MRLFAGSLVLVALAASAAAKRTRLIPSLTSSSSPTPSPSSVVSNSTEPCAIASSILSSSKGVVPAKVAYDCLISVPVAREQDETLVDELKTFWGWHSERGWLKNPPSTWDLGPVDLIAELDKIKKNISSYHSEYDVHLAIQRLEIRTGNFHLDYIPDILSIFQFQRPVNIATVSDDGTSLPKTYLVPDLLARDRDSNVSISPITEINGQEVQKYLERLASQELYTDSDARYNKLMYRSGLLESQGSFKISLGYGVYDGPETRVTFANGTMMNYKNVAQGIRKMTGVTDGKSLFQKLCNGQGEGTLSSINRKGSQLSKRQSIPLANYPQAVARHINGSVAGYFMNDKDFSDVAVLKIIAFDGCESPEFSTEFQRVVQEFLKKCTEAKKKKLVIDLRENSGGYIQLFLDTFMQLFPGEVPFSAQRLPATKAFKALGEAAARVYARQSRNGTRDYSMADWVPKAQSLAFWNYVDVSGDTFTSWDKYYGPHTLNGNEYTSLFRYNMSNSNRRSILGDDFKLLNPTGPPPFDAKNIVMLTDGLCGSSCAHLHEELKNIKGIKSVVVGGRATNKGAMQTIGGTKGGTVQSATEIVDMINTVVKTAKHEFGTTDLEKDPAVQAFANPRTLLSRTKSGALRFQTRDQIRKGDKSETPLEYIYEAADCRLFYTAKTLLHPEAMWAAAWTAHMDNSKCVPGSTKHDSSISGGFKPYGFGT